MYTLCTMDNLRLHLGLLENDSGEDARLAAALEAASATIERLTRRRFQPHYDSITHPVPDLAPDTLVLRDDLLVLEAITTDEGTPLELASISQDGHGLLRTTSGDTFRSLAAMTDRLNVSGIWGYHPHYQRAWQDSSQGVQDAPLAADATTISLTSTSPFAIGQLLRIEQEFLHITGVDTLAQTVTVLRGVNGTTASEHPAQTPIEIYLFPAEIEQMTLRWALWLYREPDQTEQVSESILVDSLAGLRRPTPV